jgi:hypothetical protein
MLTNLPVELVEMILSNLDAQSLGACCLVSKALNDIISGDVVAKKLGRAIKQFTDLDISGFRQHSPESTDLYILSRIEFNQHIATRQLSWDQWQCHFLVKNASHYQIRYTEDHGNFGYYSRVFPDYDITKTVVKYLAHANYPSLSDATKALAKISADSNNEDNRDNYYYPRALKISTTFDLVEYIADEINNSKVYVCHWSISLIE